MSILITSKKISDCDKELAFKDLEQVHLIRGRILHFSSILESVLKRIITKKVYNAHKDVLKSKKGKIKDYGKLDLNDRIKLFVKFLENKKAIQKNKDFDKFKSDLNMLREVYRNPWAHGFVYYQKYERDKKDSKYKPINFIKNKKRRIPIHFKSKHFEVANKVFPNVFKWLDQKKFLRLKKYDICIR